MTVLEYLISSRPKRKLLSLFLNHPEEKFYTRQLERLISEPIGAVQRELPKLEKMGLVKSEISGRRKNYFLDKTCPIKEELKSIVLKTIAIGGRMRELIKETKNIKYAFIYGLVAEGREDIKSDIDLMVIGNIDEIKLQKKIQQIESEIYRTINYSLMSIKEFKKRLNEEEPFLLRVLKSKRIEIIGSGCDTLI
jgi:predicted nucleotidyltransferase